MKKGEPFARLPTCVVPIKYYIDYTTVDLDHYRFEGKEKIEIKIKEDTNSITCHAVELYVFNVKLEYERNGATKSPVCEEIRFIEKDQSVTFIFEETLSANTLAKLTLEFHGILNSDLRGFYRSEYEFEGEHRVMAVTQYQACDARRAFVCWDEPAIKAKYEISIVTDPNLLAISNTHVVQTQLQQKKNAHIRKISRHRYQCKKLWKFAETPIMSTYLVGMVVGEFDSVSSFTSEGVLVTVYTPLGRSERGLFALDVATKALSFFTERFRIPYPLKKLDMIAIPDFAAGAMENWGIVTYRETRLLIDSHLSSFTQKCATARTVCHELAHQWFGNLVTMEWWTSLWLNEGFARFMEFEAVHCIFPEWRVWENFVQDITMSTAMVKDSMTTSHPIEVVVNHPDEVDQIFDVISYAKGASIIRMLTEFLGRDVFYRGIHEYLVKFSYRNAQTEDLWDALEQTSGQKITNMANTWTSQTGYPIVTFFENDTKSSFEISQERFFAVQTMKSSLENSLWDIPLTYVSSEYPNSVQQVGIWQASTNFVGNRKSYTTPIRADESITTRCPCPTNGWIKFNPNQAGFYLVNYSSNGWRNLQQPVRDLQLNTVDRMSLLNSIFACARAGIVPVSQALDFSSAYINEPEHLCWTEISSNLRFYLSLFKEELFGPLFQKYVRSLFAGIMKKLTWNPKEGESSTDGQFRRDVISMLGRAGDEEIIEEAKRRFNEYFHHPQSCNLSADLRGVVFSIRARSGDETHATQLRELYERSDFIEEKLDCLSTMGMFSSHEIKLEVLEWSLENVRSQDIQYVFGSVASGVGGAEFCWNFVKDHWVDLNKRFAPYIIGRVVVSVISPFHTEEKAAEVEEYMRTRNHDSYIRVLDAAIEKIRIKSSCYMRDRDSLEKWLMTASF